MKDALMVPSRYKQCEMLEGYTLKFALFTYKNLVIINLSKFIFLKLFENAIFLSNYCKYV